MFFKNFKLAFCGQSVKNVFCLKTPSFSIMLQTSQNVKRFLIILAFILLA